MFQQRHFEAIAAMMQGLKPSAEKCDYVDGAHLKWEQTRNAMSRIFSEGNPRFDRSRFERACEPGANARARS